MPIFSQDIRICATAYVRAENEADAAAIIARTLGNGNGAELPVGDGIDIAVSGHRFDDPRLPDVSISPAISLYGAWHYAGICRADD